MHLVCAQADIRVGILPLVESTTAPHKCRGSKNSGFPIKLLETSPSEPVLTIEGPGAIDCTCQPHTRGLATYLLFQLSSAPKSLSRAHTLGHGIWVPPATHIPSSLELS